MISYDIYGTIEKLNSLYGEENWSFRITARNHLWVMGELRAPGRRITESVGIAQSYCEGYSAVDFCFIQCVSELGGDMLVRVA